ncbi:MAG: hypothetical protein DMG49_02370 [Acidobacteria bacterium]|nr:MAG: hypothetical protein DMG49_02370 [Acidobacteriota bacterium]
MEMTPQERINLAREKFREWYLGDYLHVLSRQAPHQNADLVFDMVRCLIADAEERSMVHS